MGYSALPAKCEHKEELQQPNRAQSAEADFFVIDWHHNWDEHLAAPAVSTSAIELY